MVADGAGRATHGPEAARLAVSCLRAAVEGSRPPPARSAAGMVVPWVDDLFSGALADFLQRAPEVTAPPIVEGACSTTLALVVLSGPWLVYAGVGDAFVVVIDRRGGTHLVVPPRPPGAPRNETAFLSVTARPTLRAVFDPRLGGVVLSTDGLEPFLEERIVEERDRSYPVAWRAARETFGNIVADLRGGVRSETLAEALAGPDFQSRKGDDIGLAIAFK